MDDGSTAGARVFAEGFAGHGGAVAVDRCGCGKQGRAVRFHGERQDVSAPGWLRLRELVAEAAADGREEFAPFRGMPAELRRQVVTLPAEVGGLTRVRSLVLYGSNLVRLPAEVGGMRALESFEPYTSYRLHWFPYELARLPLLRGSTVSTRAVYGNPKNRMPFPVLAGPVAGGDPAALDPAVRGAESVRACSVCDGPVGGTAGLRQAWISLRTSGHDVLPLLVNACSAACLAALPAPPPGYLPGPHGGRPLDGLVATAELVLFADGCRLHVRDVAADEVPAGAWTAAAVAGGLVAAGRALAFGTVSDGRVAVTVEVLEREPVPGRDRFDRVVEGTIDVPSGRVAVLAPEDVPWEEDVFAVPPGPVRVRVHHRPERVLVRIWPVAGPTAGPTAP